MLLSLIFTVSPHLWNGVRSEEFHLHQHDDTFEEYHSGFQAGLDHNGDPSEKNWRIVKACFDIRLPYIVDRVAPEFL